MTNRFPKGVVLAIVFIAVLVFMSVAQDKEPSKKFSGMCDASAGILVSSKVVVANDEDNFLRVYSVEQGGTATQQIDLNRFPGFSKGKEADLEAAASLDNLVFWIGSHGRNKNGKESPSRQVLFGCKVTEINGTIDLQIAGKPYRELLQDLVENPKLKALGLLDASKLAPKERGALNIEGLAATRNNQLLIGFRNPIPRGKALLVPLLNPKETIEGTRAKLGEPILLDLGGLGIRDIVLFGDRYLILAGSFDGGSASQLYKWNGESSPKLLRDLRLGRGNPEAIVVDTNSFDSVRILTDNGSISIDGVDCKDIEDSTQKYFECFSINLK
jgi:hypothetical protein